jgi:cell wall-associated NlpC family hydrolase
LSLISARRMALLVTVLIVSAISLPSPVAAATAPQTEAQKLLSVARNQLGDRYSWAATGPSSFDCSGLVYFVFKQAGLLDRIGGTRRTVAGYHNWFNNHGTVTRSITTAKPGDVLIWGSNKHMGIYAGNGYAISALVNPWGVTLHRIGWINLRLTAVLHVKLQR